MVMTAWTIVLSVIALTAVYALGYAHGWRSREKELERQERVFRVKFRGIV